MHARIHNHPPSRNRHQVPPQSRNPPVQRMLGDTGNKRAASILLECNLVKSTFCEDIDEHLFILNSVINNKSIIIYDNNVLIELIVFFSPKVKKWKQKVLKIWPLNEIALLLLAIWFKTFTNNRQKYSSSSLSFSDSAVHQIITNSTQ